jgi:hypothetical protein
MKRRRPPQVTNYRVKPSINSNQQNLMNWDLVEMTRRVRADDFDEFHRYAREKAGWSDGQIKQTWEAVHGWGSASAIENVD